MDKIIMIGVMILMGCSTNGSKVEVISCPNVLTHNKTDFPWNPHDAKVLIYAEKRCKELDSGPCVAEFYKRGERDYHVECGVEK